MHPCSVFWLRRARPPQGRWTGACQHQKHACTQRESAHLAYTDKRAPRDGYWWLPATAAWVWRLASCIELARAASSKMNQDAGRGLLALLRGCCPGGPAGGLMHPAGPARAESAKGCKGWRIGYARSGYAVCS